MKRILKALFCVLIVFSLFTINYSFIKAETITDENTEEIIENNSNNEVVDLEQTKNDIFNDVNELLESNQFINTIVSILVSFLGSGSFFLVLKMLFKNVIKNFKIKTDEALKNNEILKEEYEKKMNKLDNLEKTIEEKINSFEKNVNKLCDTLQTKLNLDDEKRKKAEEIISDLINNIDGSDKK